MASRNKAFPPAAAVTATRPKASGAFPRLAGQHRPYIEGQLAAFSSNSRANEIMHENSKNLTPDTERQLAAFLRDAVRVKRRRLELNL